jgi:hypothetical protein
MPKRSDPVGGRGSSATTCHMEENEVIINQLKKNKGSSCHLLIQSRTSGTSLVSFTEEDPDKEQI